MASTFKFHSSINETVPFQSQYLFPTQSTKVTKQCVKLPPKNGGTFLPGNIIRIEFPSDQYLNVLNSVLQFDLATTQTAPNASTLAGQDQVARLQRGGAQNLIKRLRVIYGSLVLEDIQEYKTLVRIFTECGVQQDYMSSTGTILDGMYETFLVAQGATETVTVFGQTTTAIGSGTPTDLRDNLTTQLIRPAQNVAISLAQNGGSYRRSYCLNLLSGIFTCKKLIPLKWMAAQLAIEITLSDVNDAYIYPTFAGSIIPVSYTLTNVNFIAELLEFDSTYDTAFYQGMQGSGVPLKFSSWHFHSFSAANQTNILQIHERSRSVKAAFAVCRDASGLSNLTDSDRFFHALGQAYSSGLIINGVAASIVDFQWRVGGRYYPSQPVRCTLGAPEALVELLKATNTLGDYTNASSIHYNNWTSLMGNGTGSKFIMACEFENTDTMPDTIAGINAEEQSDIALTVNCDGIPVTKKFDIFVHYDALLIVQPNNQVSLVM